MPVPTRYRVYSYLMKFRPFDDDLFMPTETTKPAPRVETVLLSTIPTRSQNSIFGILELVCQQISDGKEVDDLFIYPLFPNGIWFITKPTKNGRIIAVAETPTWAQWCLNRYEGKDPEKLKRDLQHNEDLAFVAYTPPLKPKK